MYGTTAMILTKLVATGPKLLVVNIYGRDEMA